MTTPEAEPRSPEVGSAAPPPAERALAIVAHPDDADFVAAGTMARWARDGVAVTLVVMTDGSKGSDDPAITTEQLVRLRRIEEEASARVLGLSGVVFLGYEDGALEDALPLRRDLTRVIRQYRPDRVICMDPTVRWVNSHYINHPDHIAGGNAVLSTVAIFARNRRSFPDLLASGLEPHKVRHVYIAGPAAPDCWVDIGATIDQKIEALKQHRSQLGDAGIEAMLRDWARGDAQGHEMEYAEAFKHLELE